MLRAALHGAFRLVADAITLSTPYLSQHQLPLYYDDERLYVVHTDFGLVEKGAQGLVSLPLIQLVGGQPRSLRRRHILNSR